MQRFVTHSPEETMALGARLAARVRGGQLIAFTGEMGSGKTTFCRGLAQGLGCKDPVQSPSYAIAHLYRGPRPLAHFDAWRVTGAEDLEAAGFYDLLDGGAVVAVEWSENIADCLPEGHICIHMESAPDGSRCVTVEGAEE